MMADLGDAIIEELVQARIARVTELDLSLTDLVQRYPEANVRGELAAMEAAGQLPLLWRRDPFNELRLRSRV